MIHKKTILLIIITLVILIFIGCAYSKEGNEYKKQAYYENSEKHQLLGGDIISKSYLSLKLSDSWLEDKIIITIYEHDTER